MVEVWVYLSQPVLQALKRTAYSVIPIANQDTLESVLFVGKTAHKVSLIRELIV